MQEHKNLLVAQPSGLCAGVARAIEICERALEKFGAPIYVKHEIVHNTRVVNDLKSRGVRFIERIDDVPRDSVLVFSAHGVSRSVQDEAKAAGLTIFDGTCPFVSKVHVEIAKLSKLGYEFVLIGHRDHPEVLGTLGQLDAGIHLVENEEDILNLRLKQDELIAVVTQTTLSTDDASKLIAMLRSRFPRLREPKHQDVCYATQNRQDAVRLMAPQVEVVIVVGSVSSSNSQRLRELSERLGARSYLVDGPADIRDEWFENAPSIGLTAGASVTPALLNEVLDCLKRKGARAVRHLPGPSEDAYHFPLPAGLALSSGSSVRVQ